VEPTEPPDIKADRLLEQTQTSPILSADKTNLGRHKKFVLGLLGIQRHRRAQPTSEVAWWIFLSDNCRTAALGGHVDACEDCGHWRIAYNSCRNRHCPKCPGAAARIWLAEREADLLPIGYFHVVFTLPAKIADVAGQNKAIVYDLLFRAASETMITIAADPRHLGARIGITAVLHTWRSTMTHHPHVHMIVPGGGISLDGRRWISSRPAFLLPVRVLGALFRRLFLTRLTELHGAGRLAFFGTQAGLADRRCFLRHLAPVRKKRWVVYAKPPFTGPEAVLAYLSRYTHRVAISNRRHLPLQGLPPRWS
jgi:hypothetical protein